MTLPTKFPGVEKAKKQEVAEVNGEPTTSETVSTDSLLPQYSVHDDDDDDEKPVSQAQRNDKSTLVDPNAASCYHVHFNHFTNGEYTVTQTACCDDESSKGTFPANKNIHFKKLGLTDDTEILPPYKASNPLQAVWSTETSKLHPGCPRNVLRDQHRMTIVGGRVAVFLCTMAGIYLIYQALVVSIRRMDVVQNLHIAQREALAAFKDIPDIYNIPAELQGKLVHASGPLSIDDKLSYRECNVSVSSVVLKRTIDRSHQYMRDPFEEPYFMSEKWPDTRVGKDQICTGWGSEYENSLLMADDIKIAYEVKIGNLTLGSRLKEKFDEFFVTTDKLMEIGPDKAIRVMYSEAGRNGETFSVLGQLVQGKIEPYGLLDYYDLILQRESEVSAEDMINDRVNCRLESIREGEWTINLMGLLGFVTPLMATVYYIAAIKKLNRNYQNHALPSMPAA